MSGRIVVLHSEDPLAFVADVCGALAEAVNGVRACGPAEAELVDVYAELVVAWARLTPGERGSARAAVIDHLLGRLRQAQAGEIRLPVVEVVDRLHGELAALPAGV